MTPDHVQLVYDNPHDGVGFATLVGLVFAGPGDVQNLLRTK